MALAPCNLIQVLDQALGFDWKNFTRHKPTDIQLILGILESIDGAASSKWSSSAGPGMRH